ncbi:positive regulator of sigma E activity [Bacillus sp. SORGH_AS 510]|nr:positive regulator of sigma E activity [Bacillus sp. SORGH_AS_0510]
MERIARKSGIIYFFAVFLMFVKNFLPLEQKFHDTLSIIIFLIVLTVAIIKYRLKKQSI